MYQGLLRSIPLFSALPDEELRLLSQGLTPVEHPAGVFIFREGEANDRFSIIAGGEIEITRMVDDNTERVLQTLRPGDFFGEVSLLFADSVRSASGRTRTPVQLLEIQRQAFGALLGRYPALAVGILRSVVERLRITENAVIADLRASNQELAQAYRDLQAAQARLIEQERFEYELRTARQIQERMLPKGLPAIGGWSLSTCWHPARTVGGDFYDCFPTGDGRVAFVIGDVTGKGVPAALVMATTCSLVRFVAEQMHMPGPMLARINNRLAVDIPNKMFVTCLIAVLEPATGHLRFANAGHNLPLVRGRAGVRSLRARGMPLGLLPEMVYEEQETVIEPGELLMLYSDGIVEARNAQRELFGDKRLSAHLAAWAPGRELTATLCEAVTQFTGPGREQEDDISMFVIERHAAGG
jgi:serine phosphatase RsbU (regulator of sigma subunit)